MQLKPLYTIRFFYPESWEVRLKDPSEPNSTITEEEHFYFADGKCEGRIVGEFHGANHPHRRVDKSFAMNLQGFIKTEDGATIMPTTKATAAPINDDNNSTGQAQKRRQDSDDR